MSKSFNLKSKKSAEAVRDRGGNSADFFKVNPQGSELLILPPVGEDGEVVFTTIKHEFYAGSGKNRRLIKSCASPSKNGDKDELTTLAWQVKDKYDKSDSKKENEFYKCMLPNTKDYVCVIDLANIKKGPQIYGMSNSVSKEVLKELKKCGEDLTSICDFDEGRVLLVETNGESGIKVRYTAEFLDEQANLLESGDITEGTLDEWANSMPDMSKLQPKFDEQEFEDYMDFIFAKADEIDISLDIDEEVEEEVEEEEAPRSRSSSRGSKRTSSRREKKDEVEEEEEFNENELDTEGNEPEEDDEPQRRSSRSSRAKKEDADIEEDEEPKRRSSRRSSGTKESSEKKSPSRRSSRRR